MYQYQPHDHRLVKERVAQFRDQTERFLRGELSEEAFRPLRLMNGLYLQRHAPMLRIAIPYGLLASRQLRTLADIARRFDRGYGHFTTRQNIQFNWVKVAEVPDILEALSAVEMHAIQTSGNCIRNVTTDALAGVAADEVADPRPYCELIRQWSTLHPEFSFLPRKFKIAVTGAPKDRAASQVHDIGLHLHVNERGERGFEVLVGGGLGRTPTIGRRIRDFLPERDLLSYLEAILRLYNEYGRRDNKYKARIKILVSSLGIDTFRQQVEAEWVRLRDGALALDVTDLAYFQRHFTPHNYDDSASADEHWTWQRHSEPAFDRWMKHNTVEHRQPGYRAVVLSLKAQGQAPGDLSAEQMDAVADLADHYSFGQVRVTHAQNLILADVRQGDLLPLWRHLRALNLAEPNIASLNDIICCPGLDYCSLANASSIPVAEAIQQRFNDLDFLHDLGPVRLNLSGCMNGCGHHSVGHIGLLGVDKKGDEWYQITLGGSSDERARLGKVLGPAVRRAEIVQAIEAIIATYLAQREHDEEPFLDTVLRTGLKPFKERVYAPHSAQRDVASQRELVSAAS